MFKIRGRGQWIDNENRVKKRLEHLGVSSVIGMARILADYSFGEIRSIVFRYTLILYSVLQLISCTRYWRAEIEVDN
ncbi:hypothetical protein AG1IA_10362 [Rhizoctonia solani AG-1 IA]|uniref:Uncharacterized protein n=1 Tax=Thanatephorus cucumeris (strain AG1-IA) TaxID=983506 RepID=L8WFP4_THACA|nr:hypothetical protein AG1IA_10362 [Rhizoctonia solani AG-1 IA]